LPFVSSHLYIDIDSLFQGNKGSMRNQTLILGSLKS